MGDTDLESLETDSPHIKSEAPEIKPASTANAKTATIGDPNSDNPEPSIITFEIHQPSKELSVTDSPPIRSEAQETKTESPKTQSPPIKSESPKATNESSETDSAFIKSEASETKFASATTKPKTTTIRDIDSESPERNSASIKSEAPETEIGTQSPSIYNFESHKPSNASTTAKTKTTTMGDADLESLETDSPHIKSDAPEVKPASTANAKTATIGDPNSVAEKTENEYHQQPSRKARATRDIEKPVANVSNQETDETHKVTPGGHFESTTLIKNIATLKLPSNPDCNETEIIVINKTSKSIALDITNDKDLCIQIQLQPFNKTCSPAGPVIFQNLKFSQRYDFSIFSYEKGNTTRTSLSPSSCSFSTYTLPRNPDCNITKMNVVYKNSSSMTLNFTNTKPDSFCVQIQNVDQLDNKACRSAKQPVTFTNLSSSHRYTFSVFSFVSTENTNQSLLSQSNCSFSAYTLPKNPDCNITKMNVWNRNSSSMTLNFTNTKPDFFCVQIQNEDQQHNKACRPAEQPVTFSNLSSSHRYTFSVFSFVSIANYRQSLLSESNCSFSAFTRPADPSCSEVSISNKTTSSMVLDLKNLRTLGVVRHFVEIFQGNDFIKNLTVEDRSENIIGLAAGTIYTFKIFALSEQNIRSVQSCQTQTYTYPGQPTPSSGVPGAQSLSELNIKWNPPNGSVDTYDINVQCDCSCSPKFSNSTNKLTTKITGLLPGTHCSIQIQAIFKGLSSKPLVYKNIETAEAESGKVSNVTTTVITPSGFTVIWSEPTESNGDLTKYIVKITNATYVYVQDVPISSPKIVVNNLNPGNCYNVSIAAVNGVGEGAKTFKTIYTTEQRPSKVSNLTTSNTSSTSIAVTWLKPEIPNGVISHYKIVVEKVMEESQILEQNIWLRCVDCQSMCPSAESNKTENANGASAIEANVTFTASNQTMGYEITQLEIFTNYSITVIAYTKAGAGNDTNKTQKTSADKPSSPGKPINESVQIHSLSFVYDKPKKENGEITNQEIEFTYRPYNVCSSETSFTPKRDIKVFTIQTKGKQYFATLEDLKSFWIYTIRVRVSTYAGYSNYSKKAIIQTLSTTPEPVSDITAVQNASRHIKLRWTQPCHPNGLIINYTIEVKNKNDSSNSVNDTRFTNNSITSYNVTHLLPYRSYLFIVRTQVEGVAQLSAPQESIFQTSTEAPYSLGKITIDNITSTSVTLSWEAPELETGPTKYIVTAIDKETSKQNGSCETLGFSHTSCSIHGLDAYWPYLLVVHVRVEDFPEKINTTDIRTLQSAPGSVSNFTVTQDPNVTAKTNVHIKWSPPVKRDLNGVIQKYFIQYWYQPNQKTILPYDNRTTNTSVIVKAEKTYTFQIFATTIYNATEHYYSTMSITIRPGAPLPPSKQNVPLINKGPPASDDQTQITVAFNRFALCDDSNGKIVQWYIIVSKSPGVEAVFIGARKDYLKKIENSYKKWEDVYEKDVNDPYIASDSWNPHCESGSRRKRSAPLETISYTLGSDGDCESGNRKYCNGNLKPGQTYRVRYAVCTAGGCLESEFSEPFQTAPNHVPAIAGSLTAVVLVLVLVIVVIIILKRRGKGPFKSLDNGEVGQQNEAFAGVEMKGAAKPKAVKIADFANYVQKLHADSNLLFSSEYKLLKETCPTHTTKAAEVQVNRIKNRYTNILSYDHSRVKLLPTEDDEGSDYINANYMPGYTSPREYIATQGPLPFTRDDFWRMIWEQNVSIIVMLTQLVERGRRKCDIYWPEASREPVYYGDLVVELESESTLPDYVLRVMSIKLGNRVRKVKQLHYLKWPDMGCPETTWLLLNFVGATRLYLPHNDPGPIVVHCSAGVGRTGTFIAVDYLMQHVRTSDVIDIYSYVMKMRNNRPNMVQTEDQYVFIHDCIKDYVNKNDDDTDDEEEEEEKQEDQSIYMNV